VRTLTTLTQHKHLIQSASGSEQEITEQKTLLIKVGDSAQCEALFIINQVNLGLVHTVGRGNSVFYYSSKRQTSSLLTLGLNDMQKIN